LVSWSVRILLMLIEMLPIVIWRIGGELFYHKLLRRRAEEREKLLAKSGGSVSSIPPDRKGVEEF